MHEAGQIFDTLYMSRPDPCVFESQPDVVRHSNPRQRRWRPEGCVRPNLIA
jgi:hypothetical protein